MGKANLVLFWAIQSTVFLAFVYPPSIGLILLALASHYGRMIGITLCFHRHMAHRAFDLSRPVRLAFAWLGTAALQKGPLWWAGNHVYHHKFADREGDPHSPLVSGFFYSHMGWFTSDIRWDRVDPGNPVIRHFSQFQELRWLDRYYAIPPLILASVLFLAGGWPALVYKALAAAGLATDVVVVPPHAYAHAQNLHRSTRTPVQARADRLTA